MDRSRRQPVASSSRSGAKSALEALKAAREGGAKRVTTFEVRQEAAVYDVVSEDQYADLAAKRRAEGGNFIVDDDGHGYMDIGEDDYWREGGAGGDEEEEEEGAEGEDGKQPGKKAGKKADPKDKGGKKRAAAEAAAEGSGNIAKMFKTAATRPAAKPHGAAAAAARPSHESSDALLQEILGGLGAAAGGSGADTAPLPSVLTGPSHFARPAVAAPKAPSVTRPLSAPAPAGTRPPAAKPAPPATVMAAQPVYSTIELKPHVPKGPSARQQAPQAGAGREAERSAQAMEQDEDDMLVAQAADDMDAGDNDGTGAGQETAGTEQQEQQQGRTAARQQAAARQPSNAASPSVAPAPLMPTAPSPPPEEGRPACGWAAMYDGSKDDGTAASGGHDEAAAAGQASPLPSAAVKPEGEEQQASPLPGQQDGLPLDADGNLPFFFVDAYENTEGRPGEVFLFGKVPAAAAAMPTPAAGCSPPPSPRHGSAASGFVSCCALVRGLHRSLLVVPTRDVFDDRDGRIKALEAAVVSAAAEGADPAVRRKELIIHLHERCTDVKAELKELLSRHGVKQHRMVPVKRNYAFEVDGVPHGEQWVLKVRYSAAEPALPLGTTGRTFVAVFGAQQSPLEALLLKRRIKGPSWLALRGAVRVDYANQVSWCKVEVTLSSGKGVVAPQPASELAARPAPRLSVASISLKTIINPVSHQHEVVAAGVVHLGAVDVEAPMSKEAWNRADILRNFAVVRKLEGQSWPPGFEAAVAAENATPRGRANGGTMVTAQPTERSLLTCLLAKLQSLDADVLVGHNLGAGDLTTLLYRMQHHKVPLWSRIGRLKRQTFPKLTGGGHSFGGGASAGVMTSVAGRLLVDTYLLARELVREVDYTLRTLASSLLSQAREELGPSDVPRRFENSAALLGLCRHAESDAWLALGIMFHLSALPLSKQLTNLSGSLWSRTLAGARAQRIEMLLLHEFHERKFILPDKLTQKEKERLAAKSAHAADDEDVEMGEEEEHEGAKAPAKGGKKSKGPQYAGGLVLEPKKGLYDKIVILLDFNSLYPSIIQEYNICFTTVQRTCDGPPPLPDAPAPGTGMAPLPTVIQNLVQKRRQVKAQMSNVRDPTHKQQLNIRQQALKLTANSMYGCLGFGNSRFFARPLAELITAQGRAILQSTVDTVQGGTINGEVIYGDTDSIMIYTGTDDIRAARELGAKIKKEVNKRYKLLEIELDGIFKCMLLLKKKKYAAVKLDPSPAGDGSLVEVMEQKGLDIVRRDWCPLSKDAGNYVLAQILSGRPREDVVMDIHNHLRHVREQVDAGAVPLGKFIITKQLTKSPEDYPDAKGQPHVMVALRRKAAGKREGASAGETVPYIICVRKEPPATPTPAATPTPSQEGEQQQQQPQPQPQQHHHKQGGSFAERAYHPDELRESNGTLVVDFEYYLGQQVHPVVSRLCAPIEGTDASRIADCLGLDPQRFKGPSSGIGSGGGAAAEDVLGPCTSSLDDDNNFVGMEPLLLTAPGGGGAFPFLGVSEVLHGRVSPDALLCPPDAVGDPSRQLSAAQLVNQVVLRAREVISRYYDCQLVSDDETAALLESRNVVVRAPLEVEGARDCCPHPDPAKPAVLLSRTVSERRLYLQLAHFLRQLDVDAAVKRVAAQMRAADPRGAKDAKELAARVEPLKAQLEPAAKALKAIREVSGYHWVDLAPLFGVGA